MTYVPRDPSYTNFRAVSVKDGIVRLADPWQDTSFVAWKATDGTIGTKFMVHDTKLTSNKELYVCDGGGSIVLKGYDILYGTSSFVGKSTVGANSVSEASLTITGVLTTCIVLVNAATSAQVSGYIPYGSNCMTAGKINVFYHTGNATAATAAVPINYTLLFPQTS